MGLEGRQGVRRWALDASQEVASGLVVACGDGPVLLEPGKEVLDHMACLVQGLVVIALLPVGAARWDHHRFVGFEQRINHPVLGVIGLVGKDGLCGCVLEQDIGALEIMRLPRCEHKSRRVAQCIDRGMDLGAQPASAASEGLLVRIPPFAPALC